MRYFKILDKDGKLCGFGKNDSIGIEITEEEYNEAMKPIIEIKEKRQVEIDEAISLREVMMEAGFTFEQKFNELPKRAGIRWKPSIDFNKKSIHWEKVEDPNARGTKNNPFGWMPNIKVYADHCYKHKDEICTCIKNGAPREFTNEYFENASGKH